MSPLCALLIPILFTTTALAQGTKQTPSQTELTPSDLAGKDLQDLWLMRNDVYASHGKPFSTAELNAYFQGRGMEPDIAYSDSRLTKSDKKNIALILARENELLKQNYIKRGGVQQINFNNIINRFQFGDFSEEERKILSQNGLLFTPSKYRQLFHVYEENDYAGVGSIITVDSVLHLYHLFFDFSLRAVEEQSLLPRLQSLSGAMLESTKLAYLDSPVGPLRDAAWRNLAVFSVASALASDKNGDGALESMEWLSGSLKEIVKTEITRCREHSATLPSEILYSGEKEPKPLFDYTQFIPRGHYTRSEALSRFFMAMMWYGQFGLHPKTDRELLQAVLLTQTLYAKDSNGNNLMTLWEEVYQPTVLFSGLSDDLGPREIKIAMDEVCRDCEAASFTEKKNLDQLRTSLRRLAKGKSRIGLKVEKADSLDKYELRFMGQRFVPDSDILQRLVKDRVRPMPMGLDVMAVLGSRVAKELMLTKYGKTWEEWPDYPENQEKLIAEYQQLKPQEWKQNFYWQWLWNLKALLEAKTERGAPFFMRAPAYPYRSLLTASASWAQLRHDTILYAKQSGAAECGGGSEEVQKWVPDPPKGYVEPNLEFYRRLKELIASTATQLKQLNVSIPRKCRKSWDGYEICPDPGEAMMEPLWKQFEGIVTLLESISTKELQGKPLSNSDYEQIRTFGSLLDHITLSLMKAQTGLSEYQGWESIGGPDSEIGTIADVHTVVGSNLALEEGVGYASVVYGIVEIEGRLKLLRGAALSYYEFNSPISERLTDEQWQERLARDGAPPPPEWTEIFLTGQQHIMPKPAYVLDPEIRTSSKQGNRGWQKLIYETGS